MSYKKTPEEQAILLEGGAILGAILEDLTKMVVAGISTLEIDAEAERRIRAAGGTPTFKGYRASTSDTPFPGTICASKNIEVVHGIPTAEKTVSDGDLLSIDIGMTYKGLVTDTAVTVPVGTIDERLRTLLFVTQQSLYRGIEAMQVNSTVADIGRAVETFVKKQGKYGIVEDLVGHGVGHALHEEPRVPNVYDAYLKKWVLAPGVVLAIEPMITLGSAEIETADDGWGIITVDRSLSAHFEHTIVLTEHGPVVATRRPSEQL